MGNSADKIKCLNDPKIKELKHQFSGVELYMLALLFTDLSARHHGVIDKETFLKFFPVTGLWGERIFERFDLKHTGFLDFYHFVRGIGLCCNSTEDEKMHLLFSLYDLDNDNYIKKKEMITMLYNYPKNHIKFITDDLAPDNGEKLEGITEDRRRMSLSNIDAENDPRYHMISPLKNNQSVGSANLDGVLNDELNVADEPQQHGYMAQREIKVPLSVHVQRESQIQMNVVKGSNSRMDMTKTGIKSPEIQTRRGSIEQQGARHMMKARKGSISTITDQSFLIATTVNTRVKEYASFMFKTFEKANATGKISYDEFKEWIGMHPIILKVFDESFHQELWSTPLLKPVLTDPLYQRRGSAHIHKNDFKDLRFREKKAEVEGYLHIKSKSGSWKKRYFELHEHALVFYGKKEDLQPKGLIFMEGCYVDETTDGGIKHPYGFTITHKSDSYEGHNLYCDNKSEYDAWMNQLRLFRSSTVMDLYNFHEKIGTGKFSIVYRGSSKANPKQEYAIKVIEKKLLKAEEKEFLLSETAVMKILDYPNMIKLIDTIETKTSIYIITEIVKDGDLFDYIISRDYLEEYDSSHIMKELFRSVYYMHSIGIIHRDLKPENILVTLGPNDVVKEPKIIDFGFAKLMNKGQKTIETCGTPNYVAPEVLRGKGYDHQADTWSLGIIMYLMIRGYLPFDAHDVDSILRNTLQAPLPLDDEHFANCSPEVIDLLSKLLVKDPIKRIDLAEALKHPWIKDREKLKKYEGINRKKDNSRSDSQNE